jgi:hypothetical protein
MTTVLLGVMVLVTLAVVGLLDELTDPEVYPLPEGVKDNRRFIGTVILLGVVTIEVITIIVVRSL